jgi:hypothetical protein
MQRPAKLRITKVALSLLLAGMALSASPTLVLAEELPRRDLELELEDIPGVTGYELQVIRLLEKNKKKKPLNFKIKSITWKARLVPGRYEMRVRSVDSRGVPGEWSEPQEFIVKLPPPGLVSPPPQGIIRSTENEKEEVAFEWKSVQGAEKYKLRVYGPDGSLVQEVVETDTSATINLPVAQVYGWNVVPVMAGDLDGEGAEPVSRFELFGGTLGNPSIDGLADTDTKEFKWSNVEFAGEYDFKLEKKDNQGNWKVVDQKVTKVASQVYAKAVSSGQYRMQVKARGDRRGDSESVLKEFETYNTTERSPAAVEQIRNESNYQSKGKMFAVASYYLSAIEYNGYNVDRGQPGRGTQSSYSAIGGTGRLGLGRWFGQNSTWGLLGTADLSGIQVGDKTINYVSAVIQGVYRWRISGAGQMRFYFGANYRELPESVGFNGTSTDFDQRKIATLGPLFGISFYRGISKKLGLQLNAQFMASVLGVNIPPPVNGGTNSSKGENIVMPSFQLGVLGSMALSSELVGFVGYAYREESASYRGSQQAVTQGENEVTLSGHYINLMLEYGF